ncbi:MAG TPA: choice-of-anchor D domain-containing protein [Terracidiphilus sp.]|jgi:FtsP/CotA-like multicopper oxidase with cupredoxin domain
MVSSCRFPDLSNLVRGLIAISLAVCSVGSVSQAAAQAPVVNPSAKSTATVGTQPVNATTPAPQRMRGTTNAQRQAAAARLAVRRAATRTTSGIAAHSNAIVGFPGQTIVNTLTLDQLYFSGTYPNYANSPLPNTADTVNCKAPNYCGLRKFVDTLPLLNQANDLGAQLPIAVPDTTTFPGSDYYEISLVDYYQQMHQDLPKAGTHLRGYVQTNGPNGAAQVPYYLGPIIVAQSNHPVRVKFTNALPSVTSGGNLFIPTDTSAMGSGLGLANGNSPYLQNRATIHMHGGNTPWISDGTPHQWTIPSSDWNNTLYQRGASVSFVPDMYFVNGKVVPQCSATVTSNCSDPTGANLTTLPTGATNDPGHGALTFYYTNQQSMRLLFYHDHAYGTTRLNVYAGEASAMVIRDQVEKDLINGSNVSGVFTTAGLAAAPAIPSAEIPIVIQDKTFVPQNPATAGVYSVPLLENGSGYTAATVSFSGGGCSPEPTATATVGDMMDPFGQYISGAVTGITLLTQGAGCTADPVVTISGNGTGAVAFASLMTLSQEDPTWDSAQWGSYGNLWYPHVYMTNQWPGNPDGSSINPMGRWDYASWFWPPFNGNPGQYTVRGEITCATPYNPNMTCPGFPSALTPAPDNELDGSVHQGVGSTASLTPEGFMDTPVVNGVPYPVLNVDPKPYRFRILSVANERTFNLSWFLACDQTGAQYSPTPGASCPAPTVAGIQSLTEVGMVPAVTTAGFPVQWPNDARAGGVPDPKAMGPNWVVIGTEGGVLPAPAVIPPTPVSYEQNLRSVTVTNIQNHGLLLMSAERADAIVDFTPYAGKTLILYNDAPAPTPAYDTRYDYYTGDPDQTGQGGAPTTLAGFGPNTRTIMQVKVGTSVSGAAQPAVSLANLNALIPAAFNLTQPVPVVPEPQYSAAYKQTFTATYPSLQATQMTFTPIDPSTKKLSTIINPATKTPAVSVALGFKTIQELFDLDYGRMNATLGTELPLTNYNTQTTIPLGYIDPYTEDIYDSANVAAQPVGVAGDGSQIWMVIHNGVDSHAIHFHLYDVQLINRYGWDGTNRIPFPDEFGWKDTVRMNPLEIDFVALRPVSQTLPFPVPDSTRLFDVTKPAGTDVHMSAFDPFNNTAPQVNQLQTMGWEYVWHCHLLGHEENDMMREQVFQVPPQTPLNLTAQATKTGNVLTFTDMSLSETGFNVQRADDALFTSNATILTPAIPYNPGWNTKVIWKDTKAVSGHPYFYRVQAFKPDADYWTPLVGPLTGPGQGIATKLPNLVSGWSNVPTLQAAAAISVNPALLTFSTQAYLTTSAAQSITVTSAGLAGLLMSQIAITGTNAADFALTSTCPKTPTSLAVNATCPINVTFKPTYGGMRMANLVINSNDPTTPALYIPLVGTGIVPLTITASSPTFNWAPTGLPVITPIVTGLVSPDTLASLGPLACTSAYAPGGLPVTYPTSCSGATNPNNAYSITYVSGTLTVVPRSPVITSPVQGSLLSSSTVTFQWTAYPGVTNISLYVGTMQGVANLLNFYSTNGATSATATNIPLNGETIYVRLVFNSGKGPQFLDYTYTAVQMRAQLITPTPGSTTTGGKATFTWTPGVGATQYLLYVGTTLGNRDIFWLPATTALTETPTNLPKNGSTIYVRLWTMIGGTWYYIDYTYVAGP